MMNIIGRKNIFLTIGGVLVGLSIATMVIFGFQLNIDFYGGSLWQLQIQNASSEQVRSFFASDLKLQVSNVSYDKKADTYSIAFAEITDAQRQGYLSQLQDEFGTVKEMDFWSISPAVSSELKQKAMSAIAFVLLGISLYVAFAFRKVSKPISSWKYGIITLVTLFHDVAIPAGLFAVMGAYRGIAVDINFVVALLVIMGSSVHDTIVVFDRIRENLLCAGKNYLFTDIVNKSVNETMQRSINTSMTIVVVLLALYFLGPLSLKFFILTILVGTVAGTYSSIFIASPLLVIVENLSRKRKNV
ncbi:MAG: protein translocase subunit SecF [bacterium]